MPIRLAPSTNKATSPLRSLFHSNKLSYTFLLINNQFLHEIKIIKLLFLHEIKIIASVNLHLFKIMEAFFSDFLAFDD